MRITLDYKSSNFEQDATHRRGSRPMRLATLLLVWLCAACAGGKAAPDRAQQPSTSATRRSSSLADLDVTSPPGVVEVSPIPGIPTPYWLFDAEQAVRYVQDATGASNWTAWVVKRTTALRASSLFEIRPEPLPPLAEDRTEPVWIVAWEAKTVIPVGQGDRAMQFNRFRDAGMELPTASNASEGGGTRAYMIVNEGQSPIQFGYLNTLYHDGTIVEHPVTFAMIEALPDVPGSIAR